MTHSSDYVRAYHRTHAELEAVVREPDPSSRAAAAIASIEAGVLTLHELGPYWVDSLRVARAAGDLREIAMTAWSARP